MPNRKISQLDPIGTIDANLDSIPIVDYSEGVTKRTNLANIGLRVLDANTTDSLDEGTTNLYFTNTRVYTKVKAALVAGSNVSFTYNDSLQTITIAASGNVLSVNGQTGAVVLDTDDITEGTTNKYYDDTLFDASLAAKTTDDLTEGTTNLYYAEGLFDASLATKTTDDLTEGTNLYFTTTRVEDVLTAEDVTKMGNTFNGANELVQLDATGKLPAVDGSQLTNLPVSPSTGGDLYLFYNY
jgi:predicted RecA/RadA family phage recombinase